MRIGFFTVFRSDPQHFLHASALVRDISRVMPDVPVIQFTDRTTSEIPGVGAVHRLEHGPMLEQRLNHYAHCPEDEWLLVDTDVSIRQSVKTVFDDCAFDVAVTDRAWPHLPQAEDVMQTMPYNTGVVFSRSVLFWQRVLDAWREAPEADRDWMSEQRAVYTVVRSGRFRIKILPGMVYNYPPKTADDAPSEAAILHYKGPMRKAWLSTRAYQQLGEVGACNT